MKSYYEIALMQHVHGSVEDDYETVCYECEGGYSYRECKAKAKELSKYIGQVDVPKVGKFTASEPRKEFYHPGLDAGLAAVKIVCYTENDMTSYEPLYYEYYKDGKVDYKINFEERAYA
jgi:hypothetical protein